MRNLIAQFADAGLLSPELEKMGNLGIYGLFEETTGDASFKSWAPNRGLAIDVAAGCLSHQKRSPARSMACVSTLGMIFKRSDYDFVALVFETSGAVNDEGLRVLKQILRCASKRSGMGHSSYSSRAWARISCCLQISVAQMILNRDADDSISHFADIV